jgi:hypothetical protein
VGACVLRLLVEFVPRTSSTPVATWCWQTEGRSAERVILGVRPSGFILSEFQSPSRRNFIGSHSLPPLWSPNRSFSPLLWRFMVFQTRILPGVGWMGSPLQGLASFWVLLRCLGLPANNRALLNPLPKQSMLPLLVVALSSFGFHTP